MIMTTCGRSSMPLCRLHSQPEEVITISRRRTEAPPLGLEGRGSSVSHTCLRRAPRSTPQCHPCLSASVAGASKQAKESRGLRSRNMGETHFNTRRRHHQEKGDPFAPIRLQAQIVRMRLIAYAQVEVRQR